MVVWWSFFLLRRQANIRSSMAPRRRSRRRGRASNSCVLAYEFALDIAVGNDAGIKRTPNFGEFSIDASRPLRVRSVNCEMVCTSGSAVVVQLRLFGPPSTTETHRITVESRPMAVGVASRRIGISNPRMLDFYTPASNDGMCQIEVKLSKSGSSVIQAGTTVVVAGTIIVEFKRRNVVQLLK